VRHTLAAIRGPSPYRRALAVLLLAGCGSTGPQTAQYLLTLEASHLSSTTGLTSTCEVRVRFGAVDPLPQDLLASGTAEVRRLLIGSSGTSAASLDFYEPISVEVLQTGSFRTITINGMLHDTVALAPVSGTWQCRNTVPGPNAALVGAGYDLPPGVSGTAQLELVP
jgi:hypothetical protein